MTQKHRLQLALMLLISIGCLGIAGRKSPQRAPGVKSRNSEDLPPPQPTQNDVFDWQLVKTMLNKDGGNAAVSTFSVKLLLNMLYEGTGTGSQTQRELSGPLERKTDSYNVPNYVTIMNTIQVNTKQLLLNSRVFADEHVRVTQKYAGTISMLYNASVESVNFRQPLQAAQQINSWVSEGTRGLIQQLVTPESIRGSVLMLANTIYFKGIWNNVFPDSATETKPFQTGAGRTVNVPFMKQIHDHYYAESQQLRAKVLRLMYSDSNFSMVLILPNEDSDLSQTINGLSAEAIHQAINSMEETEVKVLLPRFYIEYSSSLKEGLQQLGINRIFQDNAELAGIARGGQLPLKVSDMFQKTVIIVDEKGSTASAASGSTLVFTIASEPEYFVADRPFLFFIQEESTGTLLFAGKVEDPRK